MVLHKQIGSNAIANDALTTPKIDDNSVTSSKIASNAITTDKIDAESITLNKPNEDFMKRVTLRDNAAPNALGWNPNGVVTTFTITEPAVIEIDFSYISAETSNNPLAACRATTSFTPGQFLVDCESAPGNGEELHYVVTNLPEHVP